MGNVWAERRLEKVHVGHSGRLAFPRRTSKQNHPHPRMQKQRSHYTIKFESLFLGRNNLSRLIRRVEQRLAGGVDKIG